MNNYLCRADYLRIDASTRLLIRRNGGLVKSADVSGSGKSMLHRYTDTSDPNSAYSMPAYVMTELQAACGQNILTAEIDQISQENALRIRHTPANPLDRVMTSRREHVEACEEYVSYVRSGSSANDANRALKEIDEAISALEAKRNDVIALQSERESSVVKMSVDGKAK